VKDHIQVLVHCTICIWRQCANSCNFHSKRNFAFRTWRDLKWIEI